jgi:hypothetical protein
MRVLQKAGKDTHGAPRHLDAMRVLRRGTLSWRLAMRASGSFKHFMNQLMLRNRSRA